MWGGFRVAPAFLSRQGAVLNVIPFQPTDGATKNVSGTTTSANVLVTNGSPGGRVQVRIVNPGTTTAFVKFGSDNNVAAVATADVPVLGGSSSILTANVPADGTLYAAAIMASGTATIYFTPGAGIS